MIADGRLDNWPAAPVPIEDCDECTRLDQDRADAVTRYDGPAETDARVLLRRHLKEEHTP